MITVVLILRNAENKIIDCLESIKDKVSEIVCVIDTRTTDATKQLCLHYTDKVYDFEWVNDSFSDARNFGQSKATGKWIFIIDADEKNVKVDLKGISDCNDYYGMWIIQPTGSKYESYRLFKNNKGIKYENSTHETVEESIGGLKYGGIIGEIYHNTTNENLIEKTKWLLKRHLKELYTEPNNPATHYHISNCYRTLGNHRLCIDYAQLSLRDKIRDENKATACLNIFVSYKYLGLEYEYLANAYMFMSLGYCLEQVSANAVLMDYYFENGDMEGVRNQEQIIKRTSGDRMPNDIPKNKVKYYSNNQLNQNKWIQVKEGNTAGI